WLLASLFRFQGAAARRRADRGPAKIVERTPTPRAARSGAAPSVRVKCSSRGETLRRADPPDYGSDCLLSNGSGARNVPGPPSFCSCRPDPNPGSTAEPQEAPVDL